MKDKGLAQVPFFAFEAEQARAERSQRRLLTALIASMVVNTVCIATIARKGF